ncbi:retrotransposable element Tf2 [Tanacetum coccineum]
MAYKLELPSQAQIHDVFHISQLKKCRGPMTHTEILPHCDAAGLIQAQSVAILDKKIGKVGNAASVFVLVHWSNSSPEDATWEPIEYI